jgi:hypothetical protein
MTSTQAPARRRDGSATEAPTFQAASRFVARSRLIHDWATAVLREAERDEVLAVLRWLAVHGDRSCLGALAVVAYRFPGDAEIAAAGAEAIERVATR